jgi:hypothetical protein
LVGVVKEIAALLRRYRISQVTGDRYAGQWPRQIMREAGIRYLDSERDRSAAYLEVEPFFAQGRIGILDHPVLVRELKLLERRPQAGGRTRVDHPSGAHDDHANALALAAALAIGGGREPELYVFQSDEPSPEAPSDSHLSEEEKVEARAEAEHRAEEEARALDAKQRRYLYEEGWRRL